MVPLNGWTPDDLLKALGLLGAAVVFAIGLFQYRRAQQWKRAEWVAQEMKQWFADPLVQAALLMIDWGSRRILLYPGRENVGERYVRLNNDDVARALMLRSERPDSFSELEADIREAFDRALDGLERFYAYVETGLVELDDLEPYLKYWAVILCRPRPIGPGESRLLRLRTYMDTYGFEGAHALLRRIAATERGIPADLPKAKESTDGANSE